MGFRQCSILTTCYKPAMVTRLGIVVLCGVLLATGSSLANCPAPRFAPAADSAAAAFLESYAQQKYQAVIAGYDSIEHRDLDDFAYCCRLADALCKTNNLAIGDREHRICAQTHGRNSLRCDREPPYYKRPKFWLVLSSLAVSIVGGLSVGLAVGLPSLRHDDLYEPAPK